MKTNTALEKYRKTIVSSVEVWENEQIAAASWQRQPVTALKSGLIDADNVAVYIPLAAISGDVRIGDVLVRGSCYKDIDDDYTIADLVADYDDVAIVRAAEKLDYGKPALDHWQISASLARLPQSAPETASIYRATETTDNAGWTTDSEIPAVTTTCWIDQLGNNINLEVYGQRIGTRTAVMLLFAGGTDVRTGDRVVIGSTSYEVLGYLPQSWEIMRKVIAVVQA